MSFLKREGVDYISNFYRHTKYSKDKDLYLITTDDGKFLFLNSSAFSQLKRGKIEDESVFRKLEDKGIIVNDKNFEEIVERTKTRYEFLMNGTSLHIVVPTTRCNQDCPYCFAAPDAISADKSLTDMDEDTAKETIDFIFESPSSAITVEFTGGEALARFDLVQMMTLYAKEKNKTAKKNLRITLVTNLTMANEEMLMWLIDNDVTICTSLDGPKHVHDQNRIILANQGKKVGTYDRVVYWIKWIDEQYKKKGKSDKLMALMTITKYSLPYYKQIIDEYISHGMTMVDIRGLMMVGEALDDSSLWYSYDDFVQFYINSIEYIDSLQQHGVEIEDRMRETYYTKIIENKPTYHTDYESPWGAAIGGLTYGPNGDVYACHESLGVREFKLGSVKKDSWNDLFKKHETGFVVLSSMLEANPICDRCVFKPYCGTLPVETFSQFGKFNFYPTKTARHFETTFHAKRVFDKIANSFD